MMDITSLATHLAKCRNKSTCILVHCPNCNRCPLPSPLFNPLTLIFINNLDIYIFILKGTAYNNHVNEKARTNLTIVASEFKSSPSTPGDTSKNLKNDVKKLRFAWCYEDVFTPVCISTVYQSDEKSMVHSSNCMLEST